MDPTRTTTGELLALASDTDDDRAAAWDAFEGRYRGILQATGRRLGLSAEDSEDVTQEALLDCWKALRSEAYQRERGRLRHFLLGVTRHRVIDRLRRTEHQRRSVGESVIAELPANVDELEQLLDEEARRKILCDALDILVNRSGYSEQTVRAFERVFVDGLSPEEVARELLVSTQVVYNATSRCRRRLGELADELSDLYELA